MKNKKLEYKFEVGDVIVCRNTNIDTPIRTVLKVNKDPKMFSVAYQLSSSRYLWSKATIEEEFEIHKDYDRYKKLKELFNEK